MTTAFQLRLIVVVPPEVEAVVFPDTPLNNWAAVISPFIEDKKLSVSVPPFVPQIHVLLDDCHVITCPLAQPARCSVFTVLLRTLYLIVKFPLGHAVAS